MGSNPIIGTFENVILRGGIDLILQIVCCERSRTKTHRITVYLPTIRQVISPGDGSGAFLLLSDWLWECIPAASKGNTAAATGFAGMSSPLLIVSCIWEDKESMGVVSLDGGSSSGS